MDHSEIGKRMKGYENTSKTVLLERTPVIIRIDGKAFHSFTKGFERPFDKLLQEVMYLTTEDLCRNIQGCVLGYTQSDEISLLLLNDKKLNSQSWFDNKVQKMCSIAASMTTLFFNRTFKNEIDTNINIYGIPEEFTKHIKAIEKGAMFDARCFNIPKEEVTNYFYWRQIDAIRNSKQMVGHYYFTDSELEYKSCAAIENMLITQRNINWNDYPINDQRGVCVIKDEIGWTIDCEIPVFKGEGREYIDKLLRY